MRWWQNGDLQRSFAAIVIGAAAILWLASPSSAELRIRSAPESGMTMRFEAELGAGPSAKDAEVSWDFNGDGKPDRTGKQVTYTFPSGGKHDVTVRVVDRVSRAARSKTIPVEVKP